MRGEVLSYPHVAFDYVAFIYILIHVAKTTDKYMKKTLKGIFKNNWFLLGFTFPIVFTGSLVYGYWYTLNYIETRDKTIFNDGIEVGRFLQLNEDAENTQAEIKQKQALSKQEVLNKLAQLESQNGKYRKILDTNNRYSLGLFHWQAHSVQDAYKRYYGKKITLPEAVKIAENDELATKLTYDAVFVKKELFHWKLSMCRMGMITKDCLTQQQINKLVMK